MRLTRFLQQQKNHEERRPRDDLCLIYNDYKQKVGMHYTGQTREQTFFYIADVKYERYFVQGVVKYAFSICIVGDEYKYNRF